MRVVTLHQFWATLMALALKKNETRGRRINYRGPLAIHAAKTIPDYVKDEWKRNGRARTVLSEHGYPTLESLPRGVILAVVNLIDCLPTSDRQIFDWSRTRHHLPRPDTDEYLFGNYQPGRWAWITEDCEMLQEPG